MEVILHNRTLLWQIFKDPLLGRFTRDGDNLTSLDQGIPMVDANLIEEGPSLSINLAEVELLVEYSTQNSRRV